MSDFKRPGVYLSEVLATPQAESGVVSVSSGCFVGTNPRGPLNVTLVTSFQQYVNLYGGFVRGTLGSDLLYAAYQFFNNGGKQCYVQRVVDGTETAATVSLLDREATGTAPTRPRPTLIVTAANPGAWGNGLNISIVPSPVDTNRFTLSVYSGGAGAGNIVERFSNLTMDPTDPRYVESIVNSPVTGSIYVTVADQHTSTAATVPSTLSDATPAATGTVTGGVLTVIPVAMTGGTDSTGTPTTANWQAAINKIDAVADPINLNLPGITDAPLINAALTYAANRGDVFVVIDGVTAVGGSLPTVNDQLTAASSYACSDLSVGAVYFPRPVIANPNSSSPGAALVVAPGGAILGQYAANDAGYGVQKTPAGLGARVANAVGLEIALSNDDLDTLNTSMINAIRSLPGAGVVLFGGRTLTRTGRADKYISVRRSLIYIKAMLAQITQFALFEPNYYLTWQQVSNVVDQFLLGFWQSGGLNGETAGQAFYVICDDSNNTPATVAAGEMHLDVGVATQTPAEFIPIRVSQYDSTVTVAEAA